MRQCPPPLLSVLLLLIFSNLLLTQQQQLPGSWQVLLENAGIASMHTAVTHYGTVVLLDRTDIGSSRINLSSGHCRQDASDKTLTVDCSAHSVLLDPLTGTVRPLTILTDTWCSSGQFDAHGRLVQTGGDFDGNRKIRYFTPCPEPGTCDWVESEGQQLQAGRWYATNQLLPDGRMVVVGGRDSFTLEFVPAAAAAATAGASISSSSSGLVELPFLWETRDMQMDNLYPFVHLLPDGTLFIFANRDSMVYDVDRNLVLRRLPSLPGGPRNYPSGGSSVLMPLTPVNGAYPRADVLVCGGATFGAFLNPAARMAAQDTCGRIAVIGGSAEDTWQTETMPYRRAMGDLVLLPSRDVLIVNGAATGSQGYGLAADPVLNPVLYKPAADYGLRFMVLTPSDIPRMYHSTANLLPDGRVLVAGSNTHYYYTFTGPFPTELRVETFSPEYLSDGLATLRPSIIGAPLMLFYGLEFTVTVTTPLPLTAVVELNLVSAAFSTHSYSQGQRLVQLSPAAPVPIGDGTYTVTATAPPNANVAPPSYYMLFAVNQGIPSVAVWVQLTS